MHEQPVEILKQIVHRQIYIYIYLKNHFLWLTINFQIHFSNQLSWYKPLSRTDHGRFFLSLSTLLHPKCCSIVKNQKHHKIWMDIMHMKVLIWYFAAISVKFLPFIDIRLNKLWFQADEQNTCLSSWLISFNFLVAVRSSFSSNGIINGTLSIYLTGTQVYILQLVPSKIFYQPNIWC